MLRLAILLGFMILAAAALPARSSPALTQPEQWALDQLASGSVADLSANCATTGFDPGSADHEALTKPCRLLSAAFLGRLVSDQTLVKRLTSKGVHIVGATIQGDLDFENLTIDVPVTFDHTRLEGSINLNRAKLSHLFMIEASYLTQNIDADSMTSTSDFYFRNSSEIEGHINLLKSHIDGDLDLRESFIDGWLDFSYAIIGNDVLLNSTAETHAYFYELFMNASTIQGGLMLYRSTFYKGMSSINATVGKDINLSSAFLGSNGTDCLNLTGGHVGGSIMARGTSCRGAFVASSIHVGQSLDFGSEPHNTTVFRSLILSRSNIEGDVDLSDVTITDTLNLEGIKADSIFLRTSQDGNDGSLSSYFNKIYMQSARIKLYLDLTNSKVADVLRGQNMEVGGDLYLSSRHPIVATFSDIEINGAHIGGQIALGGSKFRNINMNSVNIGMDINTYSSSMTTTSINEIQFDYAYIKSGINLTHVNVHKNITGFSAKIDGYLFLDGVEGGYDIDLDRVNIGSDLIIQRSQPRNVSLVSSSIKGEFFIDAMADAADAKGCVVSLQNTHVGRFSDREGAWPTRGHLCLDNFTFDHLGGDFGDPEQVMRERGSRYWDGWARRDRGSTLSPYNQLAAAFLNAGDRDAADEILFYRNERIREVTWNKIGWANGALFTWFIQTSLLLFAGYGIGKYALFAVLSWILSLSSIFAIILWRCVPSARVFPKGPTWCFGASLAKLIPGVEINKEFTDFFDDPHRRVIGKRLNIAFSMLGIVGWIMGALLLAAVTGLAQR